RPTLLHRRQVHNDAYESARLVPAEADRVTRGDRRVHVIAHLAPPFGPWRDGRRKIACGRWAVPAFVVMRAMRRLRDGPLDVLRRSNAAVTDRAVLAEYRALVDTVVAQLDETNRAASLELL